MSMDLTSISEDGPIIYNFSHADFEIDPPQKSTLENGRITLSEALDREDDMRLELRYVEQTRQFFQIIYDHCQEIQEIVASHCGLSPERVHVPEISTPEGLVWRNGNFHVSIPLDIDNSGTPLPPKLCLRVYLPYKVGEAFSPNNVDEKARSEAATHIWINDNCPDIPIPTLRGFGLPCGLSLENLSISCGIPRNTTYKTTDGFHLDILASHDQRLRSQDNAATNEADARAQAKDLVLMRALLDKFTDSNLRNGPFVMQMTDLCLTNIFLDRDWNVKYIIDLEGICSLPIEHLQPPQWLLTMKAVVDAVQDKYLEEFKERFESFAKIFEEEEKNTTSTQTFCSQADIIKRSLKTGGFWYWHALQNPWAMFNIFRKHILPLYDAVPNDMLREAVSPFWEPRMRSFVYQKTEQYARYCEEVQKIFKDGREIY
ncbi:hypothetical protein LOZ36_001679 [Ophidiomyces ophidiicola]|nr:hypothetical protein LOZ36_001679 [Ophidiomyces ophidiicola]